MTENLNKTGKAQLSEARRFSVAPMIDWTDRHCRYLHRLLTRRGLLFTEMITTGAVLRGDTERHVRFDPVEQPVALQLGGADPADLAEATRIATEFGYDEINLNVGCPSDRVQSGKFGACLMAEPALVADCVRAMRSATDKPVTVKCRIGIDDQDTEESLDRFADAVVEAGISALYVHARKAWLQGLSPKENRDIPPLDYGLVQAMKRENPDVFIGINGGITDLDAALEQLQVMDGVMLGRAAYHNANLLTEVDHRIFGAPAAETNWNAVRDVMMAHADQHIASGGRLIHVTRHMVGLFQGFAGARRFRQVLSSDATKPGAGPEVIASAFAEVDIASGAKAKAAADVLLPSGEKAA